MRKIVLIIILALLTLIVGCGSSRNNNSSSGSTAVTIHLGQPGASSGRIAGAVGPSSTIPSGVTDVRVTVSADDMATVQTVVSVVGQVSVTVTIEVPNGTDRHFLVEALDSSGNVLYSGSATADLAGAPIELPVALLTTTWANTYGAASSESASAIEQTADGGFIAAGTSSSFSQEEDFWVIKLDSLGAIQWQKRYGVTLENAVANSIVQTSDGGYIIVGNRDICSDTPLCFIMWVLKLDSSGAVQWENTYEAIEADSSANAVIQASDGNYVVAGFAGSSAWILKLDSQGAVLRENTYSALGRESTNTKSIQETADGGFIISGQSVLSVETSFWVLKTDSAGAVQWQKIYSNTGNDSSSSIRQTADGGYIVAGTSTAVQVGNSDFWVLKLNADGSVQWEMTYNGGIFDSASSIRQAADGGYIVSGSVGVTGPDSDMWILKLGSDGSVQWEKRYGGTGFDSASSVRQTSDGDFIALGITTSFGAGVTDFWAVKLLESGFVNFNASSGSAVNTTTATVTNTAASVFGVSPSTGTVNPSVTPSTETVADTDATVTQQAP